MLHSILEARTHSVKFLADFLEHATVEEKIDAFYIQIEIRRQSLVFRKSGHKLTGVDLILNSDYSTLMKEWEMLRHVNQDWFQEHIGYTISLFFLPVPKPLTVEYPSDVRYIIDRVSRWKIDEDVKDTMEGLNMLDEFCVRFKNTLPRKQADQTLYLSLAKRLKDDSITPDELIANMVDDSTVFAVGRPEGFIIKMGKKHIFQTPETASHTVDMSERTQYEYLLIDFSSFWNSISDIYALIGNSDYVHIVCTLFNAYYEWQFTQKPLKDNIEASGIEPPCLGYKPETGFKNIPNMKTVQICRKSRLMENAFKVLLVNLRKLKRPENCVLMTESHIAAWNSIVKTLQNALVC